MDNYHKSKLFVGQVNLKVQDFHRALVFYQNVIGFKVLLQSETTAHLSTDGKTTLVSIEQPKNIIPKPNGTTGLYHYALLLPDRSDLAHVVQHFTDIGIQFSASDHLVSEAIYLSDPEGNGIEIYADRNNAQWNWNNGHVQMAVDPMNIKDLLSDSKETSWKGLPSETVMGHMHLQVSELKNTEMFYTRGLGLEVVNRYGSEALFLAANNYHHHIALNTWNGAGAPAPPLNSAGLKSFSINFHNKTARDNIILQLKDIGASIHTENDQIYTYDPSGNSIQLMV